MIFVSNILLIIVCALGVIHILSRFYLITTLRDESKVPDEKIFKSTLDLIELYFINPYDVRDKKFPFYLRWFRLSFYLGVLLIIVIIMIRTNRDLW